VTMTLQSINWRMSLVEKVSAYKRLRVPCLRSYLLIISRSQRLLLPVRMFFLASKSSTKSRANVQSRANVHPFHLIETPSVKSLAIVKQPKVVLSLASDGSTKITPSLLASDVSTKITPSLYVPVEPPHPRPPSNLAEETGGAIQFLELEVNVQNDSAFAFQSDRITSTGHVTVKGGGQNVKLDGHSQWTIIAHDDFENPLPLLNETDDPMIWNDTRTQRCGRADTMLGGYCNFAAVVVSKTYQLPPHSFVQLTARFHFIDRWLGESGLLMLDGNTLWSQSHFHCKKIYLEYCKGIHVCGDEKYSDAMSNFIQVTIPHTQNLLQVAFSSTLVEDACTASWGIDDVIISVL